MGNLLFSPEGRISSAEFYRGGFILILIMTALSMVNLVSPEIGKVTGLLAYLLLYPWVVIWIKRLHEGSKSGWMFLVYLLLYLILGTIGILIVMIYFGDGNFMEMMMESIEGDLSEAELEAQMQGWAQSITLPAAISGILTSLATMFIGDKTIPIDENDNQYGPGADYSTFD